MEDLIYSVELSIVDKVYHLLMEGYDLEEIQFALDLTNRELDEYFNYLVDSKTLYTIH